MDSRELSQILGELPPDIQVITIDSPDKVIYVPKAIVENCERVEGKNWVYCIFRKTLGTVTRVAGVWAIGLELFPSIVPTAEHLIQLAAREAPKILPSVDFTFSQKPIPPQNYTLHFQDTSLNGKWNQDMDYIIPATGVTVSTVRAMRDLRRI
jgi:hypothetical protein